MNLTPNMLDTAAQACELARHETEKVASSCDGDPRTSAALSREAHELRNIAGALRQAAHTLTHANADPFGAKSCPACGHPLGATVEDWCSA